MEQKANVVAIVLHNLLYRLQVKGLLDGGDLKEIMIECLTVAAQLQAETSTPNQVGGAKLEEGIRAFFSIFPSLDGTQPRRTPAGGRGP